MQYAIDYGNILNSHNRITLKSGIGTMFNIQYKNWKRGGREGGCTYCDTYSTRVECKSTMLSLVSCLC